MNPFGNVPSTGVMASAILLLASVSLRPVVQATATIEGIVVKTGTNEPIQGATIELTGIAPRTTRGSTRNEPGVIIQTVEETETDGRVLSFTATTGKDGRFSIRNIPPTTGYQLIALHTPEFVPAQYGQRVPSVPGRPIDLVAGQQLRDIRIEMTPGATISGLAVNGDGQPLRNVTVELRRPWYLEGWRLIGDWRQTLQRVQGVGLSNLAGTARTNGRGEFRFSGLVPAHYYLRTTETHDADAPRIDLHAGENITNMRIVIKLFAPRRISGSVVIKGSGLPVNGATVYLIRRDAIPVYQDSVSSATNSKNGIFEIESDEPGDYFLRAIRPGNLRTMVGRNAIHVGATDIDGIRIELEPAIDISGTVTTEGAANPTGTPASPLSLDLYPLSAGAARIASMELPFPAGMFRMRNVTADDYRVEVRPVLAVPPSALVQSGMENAYVKSIRLGKADILNDGLHLQSTRDGALEIVISMRGGTIEGRVVDEDKKPAINARVVLVPESSRRQRGDLYKNASADDMGRYHLSGIAPGNYKVFAWERIEEGAW
ncbi:MAG TPA: carboxypeptidase-like regulatory domain-containing protein, partial [Terriglobia bacterium]|nr:carboxypeptidase-like regulatory domain-containing protein [Terriglobia bacterium]